MQNLLRDEDLLLTYRAEASALRPSSQLKRDAHSSAVRGDAGASAVRRRKDHHQGTGRESHRPLQKSHQSGKCTCTAN